MSTGFAVQSYGRRSQTVFSYGDAVAFLGNRQQKKLGNNTYMHNLPNGDIAVRLHSTDIVEIHPDGSYTLNTGGWQTGTTKDRINGYSPARIIQEKGIWYIADVPNWRERINVTFHDGMRVDGNGDPLGLQIPSRLLKMKKAKLDKLVTAYIKGFAADAVANGLKDPSGGDCWGCHFHGDKSEPPHKQPLGLQHILDHFEEKYYVPSLLWKAVQNYGNPAVVWAMMKNDVQRGDTSWVVRNLRSYFRKLKPALLKLMMDSP